MSNGALMQALPRALLALRITLGLFLLQWGIEKFVVPQSGVAIWSHYYGLNISQVVGYLFGAVEIAIAGCLFLGIFRTAAYGAALALHAVTVLVSWRELLNPWGGPVNHLFIAGVPVLGALLALFLLRHWDQSVFRGTNAPARP
jgi:putative oxidoreductase